MANCKLTLKKLIFVSAFRPLIQIKCNLQDTSSVTPWKNGITLFPQATTVKDLRERYKPAKDGGFYYDHRLIVRDYPQEYTIEKLDTRRTGGVDPETGHRVFPRIGGGLKKYWYWVDLKRYGPEDIDHPLVEKVCRIVDSQCHSAHLALVGHGHNLRLIIATENMKPGDLIRTYGAIPKATIKPIEGDAWPIAALPVGTMICCIEPVPNYGARYCVNAGSYGIIQKHADNQCIIRLIPIKSTKQKEISVDHMCTAVVGRVGNIDHHKEQLGSANALRRSGYRPRSGWEQKKTGRFGRKLRRMKPPLVLTKDMFEDNSPKVIKYTWDDFELKE
ncbi:hypothetical protein GJ496_003779 [Pomphorhynchus laevis]|nr:hypothetical protein GJ496_003779 [Pomphorhynchus laevis]